MPIVHLLMRPLEGISLHETTQRIAHTTVDHFSDLRSEPLLRYSLLWRSLEIPLAHEEQKEG